MTAEAPDPRTFDTWEDAFHYPVPVARKLEAQLRSGVNDNRERLRSLVGASYRDLLGTAERIVEMDQTMGQVEHVLGQIGSHCNSRMLEKVSSNYTNIDSHWRAQKQHQNAFASQLAMLQACPAIISRQFKKGGSLLLAAKILVLSRLLHKNLAHLSQSSPLIERMKDRLGYLRSRLIRRIHKHCSDSTIDSEALIDNMCAYSLATSSTPTDVLNHFHQIRIDAINSQFDHQTDIQDHTLKALNLCVRTLQDTQAIFPRQLSQALLKFKARPLVQTPDVQNVSELNLPIHERWIADEVRNYTPWPRHDELQKSDAERITKAWARQALEAFISGLDKVLYNMPDLRAMVNLRQEILETWFPASKRAPGLDPRRVLNDLRYVLNKHIKSIAQRDVNNLQSVTDEINDYLKDWKASAAETAPLWNLGKNSIDLSNGAEDFKKSVIERSRGRSKPVERIMSTYNAWAESVNKVRRVIKDMKDLRWDDDFNDDEDDDLELDSKQVLLSEDDPRIVEEALSESSEKAFIQLQEDLESVAGRISSVNGSNTRVGQTIFVFRTLREVEQRLQKSSVSASNESRLFPKEALASLHRFVAELVLEMPRAAYTLSLERVTSQPAIPGRQLWEGTPALPSLPSPATYKLLNSLLSSMSAIGPDLWSPEAVSVLKAAASQAASESLYTSAQKFITEGALEFLEVPKEKLAESDVVGRERETEEDGKVVKADQEKVDKVENDNEGTRAASQIDIKVSETVRRDKCLQLFFDSCYLSQAFSGHDVAFVDHLGETKLRDMQISKAVTDQIAKNAAEYWKRTYLMFALLA